MTTSGSEEREESGSALRARLEETIKVNQELAKTNRDLTVEKVIRDEGFKFVKPEDLTEVEIGQIKSKAAEIEASEQTKREAIRAELLAELGQTQGAGENDQSMFRVAQLGALGGTPPGSASLERKANEDGVEYAMRLRAAQLSKQ